VLCWWVLLVAVVLVVYLMYRLSKRVDDIENDAAYLYEQQQGGRYGAKFLNILRGRGDDLQGCSASGIGPEPLEDQPAGIGAP
jgi:hypothetical protein